MQKDDVIYRQAAIDAARKCSVKEVTPDYMLIDKAEIMTELMMLPPAQPEPSILLSWIEEYIEWLKGFDNEFANLEAAHISVMVKKWRDEQNERTD